MFRTITFIYCALRKFSRVFPVELKPICYFSVIGFLLISTVFSRFFFFFFQPSAACCTPAMRRESKKKSSLNSAIRVCRHTIRILSQKRVRLISVTHTNQKYILFNYSENNPMTFSFNQYETPTCQTKNLTIHTNRQKIRVLFCSFNQYDTY